MHSSDIFEHADALLRPLPISWLHTATKSVARRTDGCYVIATDDGDILADWVFDSACGIAPVFPVQQRPHASVSGTGIRVLADRPVFDPATAILFDPLPEGGFAYLLPLGPTEALVESALFAPVCAKA